MIAEVGKLDVTADFRAEAHTATRVPPLPLSKWVTFPRSSTIWWELFNRFFTRISRDADSSPNNIAPLR